MESWHVLVVVARDENTETSKDSLRMYTREYGDMIAQRLSFIGSSKRTSVVKLDTEHTQCTTADIEACDMALIIVTGQIARDDVDFVILTPKPVKIWVVRMYMQLKKAGIRSQVIPCVVQENSIVSEMTNLGKNAIVLVFRDSIRKTDTDPKMIVETIARMMIDNFA